VLGALPIRSSPYTNAWRLGIETKLNQTSNQIICATQRVPWGSILNQNVQLGAAVVHAYYCNSIINCGCLSCECECSSCCAVPQRLQCMDTYSCNFAWRKIKNHKQAHQGPGHSSGIIWNHPYPGYLPSVPSHSSSNLKHHALSCLWTLDGAARGPAMGVSSGSGLASSRLASRRRLLAPQRTLWRVDLPLHTCVLSQVVQGRSPPQAGKGRWMRRASFIEYHPRSGAGVAIGMLRGGKRTTNLDEGT
jgi:hypothetical protein